MRPLGVWRSCGLRSWAKFPVISKARRVYSFLGFGVAQGFGLFLRGDIVFVEVEERVVFVVESHLILFGFVHFDGQICLG